MAILLNLVKKTRSSYQMNYTPLTANVCRSVLSNLVTLSGPAGQILSLPSPPTELVPILETTEMFCDYPPLPPPTEPGPLFTHHCLTIEGFQQGWCPSLAL